MAKYTEFTLELVKTLETRNLDNLIDFIEKGVKKGYYSKSMVDRFKRADKITQWGTMYKMIMNVREISKETRMWAINELDKLGWSYEIR